MKFFMNLNSGPKNSPLCQIWAWSSNYLENNSVFSSQKVMWHTANKRLLWQHLITMVIYKICKTTVKGEKLKSESFFFNILWRFGVMEEELLGGGWCGFRPLAWIGLRLAKIHISVSFFEVRCWQYGLFLSVL